MSIKCKIFEHHTSRLHYLERSINDFLAEEGVKIINVTQSSDNSGSIIVVILYEEVLSLEETPGDSINLEEPTEEVRWHD